MQSIEKELLKAKQKIKDAKNLEKQKRYKEAAKAALEAAEILIGVAKNDKVNKKLKEQLQERVGKIIVWVKMLKDAITLESPPKEPEKATMVAYEPEIKSLYIIYEDGTPIYFYVANNMILDPTLVSGALTGISTLIKEITQTGTGVKKIDYGDGEIILEKGKKITIAAFTSSPTQEMRNRITKFIKTFEESYGDVLENWDGNLSKFKNLEEKIKNMLLCRHAHCNNR